MTSPSPSAALDETLRTLTTRLLAERTPAGHWEGHLASSALSTATAIGALVLSDARGHAERISAGVAWLEAHQNVDGGWGDTTINLSNISTTALVWAALSMAAAAERKGSATAQPKGRAITQAETWLRAKAGSLAPDVLAEAIKRRYGKDRTFSVPILTVLAIAGKLGEGKAAWRRVPQLPFELAACPHEWFQWLQLPVVSYALPALIAIGQARHHQRPTRNPLTRAARAVFGERTLRKLLAIQPDSGGYLEATPLTAFVVMSLAASEPTSVEAHAVMHHGVRFLLDSQRDDGSWPIDTNLATWVTTLSINALAHQYRPPTTPAPAASSPILSAEEAVAAGEVFAGIDTPAVAGWLLGQQHRVEHPYTHAAPGGWAWTDLSGGVPDADDTPGALLALAHLGVGLSDDAARAAVALGVGWLLDLQNRDGGIPTFCRGWGALPFDRSSPDLTAHAVLAWETWRRHLSPDLGARVMPAMDRAVAFLTRAQRADGSWAPLWFGNERAHDDENPTYGTSRVLMALARVTDAPAAACRPLATRGAAWLLSAQNADGGWGGAANIASSIEETALAVEALAALVLASSSSSPLSSLSSRSSSSAQPMLPASQLPAVRDAIARGVAWLIDATARGTRTPVSAIGFYFAKLWYHERLYPLIFATAALGRAQQVLR